jgi:PAS domain S-box-containing protein
MSGSASLDEAELEKRARDLDTREATLRIHEEHQRLIGELGAHFTYVVNIDENGHVQLPTWIPGPSAPVGGYSAEQVITQDSMDLIHPDDREYVWKLMLTALRAGSASGEYRLQSADGNIRWLKNSIGRIDNARDGDRLIGIVQDVTNLRRTQEALRASEQSFETLFRAAPVVMLLSALEGGRLLDVNDRFTRATGYTREEAIGKTATELGLWESPQQRDDFRDIRSERSGTFEGIEANLRLKSGEATVALLSAEVLDVGGRQCALWHAVDITDRKRAERELARYRQDLEVLVEARTEELEHSRDQLRQSERLASVGTLAAGIAHQINNPVGVIMAATQHALDCEDDADAVSVWRKALHESESQARRCARIVRSVLQFARDEPTKKWPEDLNAAVQRACNLTRSYAEQRQADVRFEAAGTPVQVLMNPVEMEQVLVNVLRNAIESKERGATVFASTGRDEGGAWVRVEDDGRGVAPEVAERVFDPFFTTRLAQGGTGLGLSVAHGIVAEHGGRVQIKSPESGGCSVSIALPLAPDSEAS